MECPQCGHVNESDDSFCSNCGTRLKGAAAMPPQYTPPERQHTPSGGTSPPASPRIPENPTDPEWRMSPLPEEEPPKRRTWLWVLVGLLVLCVLLFCGLSIFLTTGPGENLLNDLATRAADAAATPVD
jgi:hypothetical protein